MNWGWACKESNGMPTYEYECTKCEHGFEAFQSMKDDRLSTCPKCRGKLKRVIGAGAGIIFKGSGFYETDYKRGSSYHSDASKEKSSASSSSSKSKGKKKPKSDTSSS